MEENAYAVFKTTVDHTFFTFELISIDAIIFWNTWSTGMNVRFDLLGVNKVPSYTVSSVPSGGRVYESVLKGDIR